MPSSKNKEAETESRRWWIGTVIAVVGIVAGVITFDPVTWFRERGVTEAERLQACMKYHDMDKATTRSWTAYSPKRQRAGEYGVLLFKQCRWPPRDADAADGYSEISVEIELGPGDEIKGGSEADRITATCDSVRLSYVEGWMGETKRRKPFMAKKGEVLDGVTGDEWTGMSPYPYPRSDEILILENEKLTLNEAKCI